jgi:predicted DNA-binding transcriptional regulator YafY
MKVLEAAGISFFFDKNYGGYRLQFEPRLPIPNLTPDELLAQGVAASAMQEPNLSPGKKVRDVARKMSAAQRDERSKILDDAQRLIQVLDLKLADHSQHEDMIRTAQWGLVEGKQLAGVYESPYQTKPTKLRLHPYRIVLIQQAWYLIARSHDLESPRTYRLHRFKSLRILDDASIVPPDFDVSTYFGNAWAVYRGDKAYDIELRFTQEAAPLVTETRWHSTQKVKREANGEVTLTFRVDGLDEILWWVISWTGRVEVRQPAELRHMVLEQLQKGIDLNRSKERP